ncbi:MAG: ABC transporter permease [Gorillibacterium sp.]|nr:ABC transporter permease [Gorillibacterium sp.]
MRIRAIVLRIIRQFRHDKRTLAMMFAAPVFILTLVSFIFNGATYSPKMGMTDIPPSIIEQLSTQDVELLPYTDSEAMEALKNNEIDAVIGIKDSVLQVQLEGSNPTKNKAVLMLIQKAFSPSVANAMGIAAPHVSYLHGSVEMTAFDNFGPVLVGVFAFFFVFLIGGISFLRERTSGTLERLLASPLRKWEIVCGYVAGFGVFTFLQSALIVWFTVNVLGLMMEGSFGLLLLITLLLTMTALTLGILLSTYANNEFQMIQFIPLVITPQIFFSGLFDLDTMAPWLRWLSTIMPLKYGADALRDIMIRGEGWNKIAPNAYLLIGLSLVFMLLNILALRKHRRI